MKRIATQGRVRAGIGNLSAPAVLKSHYASGSHACGGQSCIASWNLARDHRRAMRLGQKLQECYIIAGEPRVPTPKIALPVFVSQE